MKSGFSADYDSEDPVVVVTACCSLLFSKFRRSSAYSSAVIFPAFLALPAGLSEGSPASAGGVTLPVSECGAEIDRRFRGYETKTPDTSLSGDTGFGDLDEADGVLLRDSAPLLCPLEASCFIGGSGLGPRGADPAAFVASAMFRRSWATLSAPLTQSLSERRLAEVDSVKGLRTALTSKLEYSFSCAKRCSSRNCWTCSSSSRFLRMRSVRGVRIA